LARQAAEAELQDVAVLKEEFYLPGRKSLLVGVVEFRIAIFAFPIIKAILGVSKGGTVGAGIGGSLIQGFVEALSAFITPEIRSRFFLLSRAGF
jgi:hypothetical protein